MLTLITPVRSTTIGGSWLLSTSTIIVLAALLALLVRPNYHRALACKGSEHIKLQMMVDHNDR